MLNSLDFLQAKILIVDDQQVNILLLERVLNGAGYLSVSSTMDPAQVCTLHTRDSYDLIMLDLQMPGMDGFQVMEALKKIEPDGYLPVLVITCWKYACCTKPPGTPTSFWNNTFGKEPPSFKKVTSKPFFR